MALVYRHASKGSLGGVGRQHAFILQCSKSYGCKLMTDQNGHLRTQPATETLEYMRHDMVSYGKKNKNMNTSLFVSPEWISDPITHDVVQLNRPRNPRVLFSFGFYYAFICLYTVPYTDAFASGIDGNYQRHTTPKWHDFKAKLAKRWLSLSDVRPSISPSKYS